MKKIVFAFAVAIALFGAVSPFVFADDIKGTEYQHSAEVILSREDLFSVSAARFPEEKMGLMYDDVVYRLYEILKQGMANGASTISLEPFYNEGFENLSAYSQADLGVLREAFSLVVDKSPELFYVKRTYRYSYTNEKITSVLPQYSMSGASLTNAKRKFESYIDGVVSLIPENFSDYEKILFVNDYLCVNYEYDTDKQIHDAYSFFEKGMGVCEAYTLAFMAVMDRLEIPCDSVQSDAMNHIWNYVKLDGKWYHTDVTWNDPVPDVYGKARHSHLLLSDDGISQSHYGYEREYECSDTTYDNACDTLDINSAFAYIGGKWYVPRYDGESSRSFLYELKSPNLAALSFDTPVFDLGRWMTGEYSFYRGSYCYLSVYKDAIIFNTEDTVYVFDGENISELYRPALENGSKIYGFCVKDDALMLQLKDNPNNMASAERESLALTPVIFKNHDGVVLKEAFSANGGTVPEMLVPQAPEKPSDVAFEYEFSQWKKTVTTIGIVFTPEYNRVAKKYTHKFLDFDGRVLKEETVDYGRVITPPQDPERQATVQYSYAFDGWENFADGMTQTGEELVFTAKYTRTVNKYTHKFLDFDGRIIKEETVDFGTEIIPPQSPERPAEDRYSFVFKAWENFTPGMTQTGEELVFTAKYRVITDAPMGDITGDGNLNLQDLLRFTKYFAGWNVTIDIYTADVTGDGEVDVRDLMLLAKYFAHWNVTLG